MESMYIYAFGKQLNQLKEQLDQQNSKQINCTKNTCQETEQLSQQGTCCPRKQLATNL